MRRLLAISVPAAVLVICEVLLQWHGWQFWAEFFDPKAGPALSMALAILAAAWWFQASTGRLLSRLACYVLGAVASCLLLAGPLYMVSRPVIDARTAADALPVELARIDAELAVKRDELKGYIDITSTGRFGWAGRIDDTRAAIAELEKQRAEVSGAAVVVLPWQTYAVCGLQVAALVLLQIGTASMAATCGKTWHAPRPVQARENSPKTASLEQGGDGVQGGHLAAQNGPVQGLLDAQGGTARTPAMAGPAPQAQEVPEGSLEGAVQAQAEGPVQVTASATKIARVSEQEMETAAHPGTGTESGTEQRSETLFQPNDLLIRRLQRVVNESIQASGQSMRQWATESGVHPRDVSLLLNHFENVKTGKAGITGPKVKLFAQRFLAKQSGQA